MTPKELYEKYINRRAFCYGMEGIVVGYTGFDDTLIMAVISGDGWTEFDDDEFIFNMLDNSLGYWYVCKEDIKFKFGKG